MNSDPSPLSWADQTPRNVPAPVTPYGTDLAADAGYNMEAPQGGNAFGKYLATLNRYKWWALAILVLGTMAGIAGSRFVKPTYVVQAKVWFDRDGGGGRGPIQDGQLLNSQSWIELLRSYAVLDSVVQEQRLYLITDPAQRSIFANFELKERFRPGEYRLRLASSNAGYVLETRSGAFVERAAFGDSLGRTVGFKWVPTKRKLDPKRGLIFNVRRPRDRARELGAQITTNMPKDGTFMQLELRGRDPVTLTRTMNSLVHRFADLAAELKRVRLNEFAAILDDQLRVAEQNLQSAEMGLENLRVNTITQPTEPEAAVPASQQTASPMMTNFMTMKVQQDQLRQDRQALLRAMAHAKESGVSTTELQGIGSVSTASELQTAITELTTKRAGLRALQYRYTDDYADVRRLKGELQMLEGVTIPKLVDDLIAELDRRDAQIESVLSATSTEMRAIPPRLMEEARLTRQVTIADNIYTTLRQRHEEARLAALSSRPDVRIVDEAVVPHSPVKDESTRVIIVAIALSLGLILGGVVLLEKFDPHVRYPEHVTHGFRLPILTAIPRLKTGSPSSRSAENTAAVVEAFRTLRLSVLQARGTQGTLVLSITSPGTGDGKSFVAMNLAFALADQGYRTLLIDGDVRRGGLHHLVDTNRKPGLTDLLAGDVTREQAIRHTPYPLLDLIPCGKRVQAGPELLGSPALTELIQQMRGQYSIILVDCPPLGAGVDAFVLGMAAGNLLMVVRTGQSDREFTAAKLAALDRLPIRILGAVLNGVPAGRAYRYYGYLPGYEANEEQVETERRLPVPG